MEKNNITLRFCSNPFCSMLYVYVKLKLSYYILVCKNVTKNMFQLNSEHLKTKYSVLFKLLTPPMKQEQTLCKMEKMLVINIFSLLQNAP